MVRSEHQSYLHYGLCVANDDWAGARSALQKCIDDPAFNSDPIQLSDLLRRMGEIYFELGDRLQATKYFAEAERADPDSLLVKLQIARFVANRLGDKQAAIEQCDAVISLAHNKPYPESDDDFGSADYARSAEELKRGLMT